MEPFFLKLKEQLKKDYIFHIPNTDVNGQDTFYCSCGNVIENKSSNSDFVVTSNNITEFDFSDLDSLYTRPNIICEKCETDYSKKENYSRIQLANVYFKQNYYFEETDSYIKIYKIKLRGSTKWKTGGDNVSVNWNESYIKVNKDTKEIIYKDFYPDYDGDIEKLREDNSKKIELENVIFYVKEFFKQDKEIIIAEGLIHIHEFIGKLSRLIMDAQNMNIVDELLNQMIGQSGFGVMEKVVSVFLGILCYPNLSTIALTKGNLFLYQLMTSCQLPNTEYLLERKATSPIKIFNALISIKNEELQKNLDEDDPNKLGYVFVNSQGKEFNFKFSKEDIEKAEAGSKVAMAHGTAFIRDTINNKEVSPFIFSKLVKFSDYKKIIQWLKFISYEELINLVKEYDMDVLNAVFELIEFRDDIDIDRIKQFLNIIIDYINSNNDLTNLIRSRFIKSKFDHIKTFDFNLYDDCMRMILELDWDPKKVLFKINKFDKLGKLHDDLIKHRSFIPDDVANKKYVEFIDKFRYLTGNFNDLSIELIETPKQLLDDAKAMHNCAGSYINKVANGVHVPFLVYDNSLERKTDENYKFMMILESTKIGLEFIGVKSKFNKYGSDRFKKDIMNFLVDKDISFKEVPSIKLGVQSSEFSYAGSFDKPEVI